MITRSVAGALAMMGVSFIAIASTTQACDQGCDSAVACPTNAFGVTSYGMCITSITSNCLVLGPAPEDAGAACGWAKVLPPSTGDTCTVVATFADGSQSSATAKFTVLPDDPCCPGTQFSIDPPALVANAQADAGAD